MTGYETMKKHREDALEKSVKELERLAEANKDAVHYLSQEAYKMGIKFAIREIEDTEMLMLKAHKELPYSNPKEAEREHGNTMRLLATIKNGLMARHEGKAFLYSKSRDRVGSTVCIHQTPTDETCPLCPTIKDGK